MKRNVNQLKFGALAAAAAAVLGLSAPAARADESATRAEIQALKDRIAQLEANQAPAARPVDHALADKAVADVLADADRRSQVMQAGGLTAGYLGNKFVIQSEDGNFVFNPNLFFQYRYVANFRQDAKNGGREDDNQSGFEIRRLKLSFDGNLFTKDLTYKFQWNTSRTNGSLVLDEGYARYHIPGTDLAVRAGTFTNGWDHETASSSKRILAVERSLVQNILVSGGINTENYVQGVELSYGYDGGGPLRASVNYNDGFNSRNTAFTDGGAGSALLGLVRPNGAFSGRVEYKLTGDWKNYEDFTALGTTKDLLVIGGGADVELADNVTAVLHTADIHWEPASVKGLALHAAYHGVYRDIRNAAAGTDATPYDWGFIVQAAYLLTPQWEVFGRYDYVGLNDRAPGGAGSLGAAARVSDSLSELTVGVNYYIKGHAAKFTFDATYLPNGSPLDLNGAGILNQPNDSAQFLFRGQFQLLL